jgi:hypothetical protein
VGSADGELDDGGRCGDMQGGETEVDDAFAERMQRCKEEERGL